MIAGQIELQMMVDMARLSKDFASVQNVITNAMTDITKTIDLAKKAMVGFLGVASVNALVGLIKGSIDGTAALHDLAQQSGITVAALAQFRSLGTLSETSIDSIAGATTKLNKTLASTSDEGKGAGLALSALNIPIEEFRRKRPEDQMLAVAQAMAQFKDGSDKSAAAMLLYGKEGAKLLPFLADLATEHAKLTEQEIAAKRAQAAMADEYGDTLIKIRKEQEAWKKDLAMGLLPALYEASQAILGMSKSGGGLKGEISNLAKDGTLAEWARNAMTYISYLVDIAQALISAIKIIPTYLTAAVAAGATGFGATWSAIKLFIEGEYSKAWQELKNGAEGTRTIMAAASEDINKLWNPELIGEGFRKRMADLKGTQAATEDTRKSMANLGDVAERLARQRKAEEDAAKAAAAAERAYSQVFKDMVDEYDRLGDAGQEYLDTLKAKEIATQAELDKGRQLTEAEKEQLELEDKLRTGKILLTAEDEAAARAVIEHTAALKEQVRLQDLNTKALEEAAKRSDALKDEVEAQRQANLAAQVGTDAMEMLTVAKLRDRAATLERDAALAIEDETALQIANEYSRQAQALRDLANAKEQGVHIRMAQESADAWKKTTESIQNGLTDALMRAFESGKGFADAFKQTIVNAFKTMVLEPEVRGIVSAGGNWLGQATGMRSAGAGGAMNGVNTVSNLGYIGGGLYGLTGMSTGASAASLTYANAVGALGGDSMGALIAANGSWSGVAAGGATAAAGEGAAAAGAGAAGGGASGLISTLGPYAIIALALYAIFGDFSKWSMGSVAEGKFGADGQFGNTKYQDFIFGNNPEHERDAKLQRGIVDSIGASLGANAKLFGGAANGLGLSLSTDLDREGKIAGIIRLLDASGQVVSGTQSGSGAFVGADPGVAASKMSTDQLSTWVAQAMPEIIVQGLQRSNLAARFDDYFNSVAATALTPEKAAQMLSTATAVQQLTDAFTPLGGVFTQFGTLSVDLFAKVAQLNGGFDALSQSVGSYYANFYTEAERTEDTWQAITKTLQEAGVNTVPKTREEFRSMVDMLDLSTDAGENAFTAFMKVQGAFAQLVPAADAITDAVTQTAAAVTDAADQMSQMDAYQASKKAYDDAKRMAAAQVQYQKDLQTPGSSLYNYWQRWGYDPSGINGGVVSGGKALPGPQAGAMFSWYMMEQAANDQSAGSVADMRNFGGSANDSSMATAATQAADLAQQELDAQRQLISTIDQLRGSLDSWRNNMLFGDQSVLDPTQKYDKASADFWATTNAALGGDITAAQSWQAAADRFLQQSDTYFGGGTNTARDRQAVLDAFYELKDELAEIKTATKAQLPALADQNSLLEQQNAIAAQALSQRKQQGERMVA